MAQKTAAKEEADRKQKIAEFVKYWRSNTESEII